MCWMPDKLPQPPLVHGCECCLRCTSFLFCLQGIAAILEDLKTFRVQQSPYSASAIYENPCYPSVVPWPNASSASKSGPIYPFDIIIAHITPMLVEHPMYMISDLTGLDCANDPDSVKDAMSGWLWSELCQRGRNPCPNPCPRVSVECGIGAMGSNQLWL